jgi:hypothetical protein
MGKEIVTRQELEALKEYFSKQGWDERVPEMLLGWGTPYGNKFKCAGGTFDLLVEGKKERATRVMLFWEKCIRIRREGMGNDLYIEGKPVGKITAVREGDPEFDGEEALRISLSEENMIFEIRESGEVLPLS